MDKFILNSYMFILNVFLIVDLSIFFIVGGN